MAYLINLYERKSFHYIDAYKHLDKEVWLGTAKVLVRKRSRDDCDESYDYEERNTTRYSIQLPPHNTKPSVIRNALYNQFAGSSCTHEYDCCGCRSYYANVKQVSHRRWSVVVTSSRNY